MKRVDGYVRYLVDNGLIFEINRKVLHPLGLTLVIDVHPDNHKWLAIEGLYKVDDGDEEGFTFGEESYRVGSERYELFLHKEGQKMLDSRKQSLGYIVQEIQEVKKDSSGEE